MGHSRAEDTDTMTVVKGGSAVLRMGRTPCGYNEAVPYFLRRTLPVFMCFDYEKGTGRAYSSLGKLFCRSCRYSRMGSYPSWITAH